MLTFDKPFTQQEPIDEATIERVADILRTGRLHRYNVVGDEKSEAELLEAEYAAYQGSNHCLAVTSGGYACAAALRAVGVKHGDLVLMNAWTLAPVPGAVHSVGGVPVMVDIDDDLRIDLNDLAAKAESSGAKYLMLSHMRGHLCDMDKLVQICEQFGITLVEDCAHTMGARWNGELSGNFGKAAAFSTQTYKHINSGEGGLLTTNDPEVAARATMLSGSYMLYSRHGAGPSLESFDDIRLDTPNCSGRMDNVRAALIRGQLGALDESITRWNQRHDAIERELAQSPNLKPIKHLNGELRVGSSLQFQLPGADVATIQRFITACAARGVEVKWFGAAAPTAFTSRYDSWRYLGEAQPLPNTLKQLSTLCDLRVPLTFDLDDCRTLGTIVREVANESL